MTFLRAIVVLGVAAWLMLAGDSLVSILGALGYLAVMTFVLGDLARREGRWPYRKDRKT